MAVLLSNAEALRKQVSQCTETSIAYIAGSKPRTASLIASIAKSEARTAEFGFSDRKVGCVATDKVRSCWPADSKSAGEWN